MNLFRANLKAHYCGLEEPISGRPPSPPASLTKEKVDPFLNLAEHFLLLLPALYTAGFSPDGVHRELYTRVLHGLIMLGALITRELWATIQKPWFEHTDAANVFFAYEVEAMHNLEQLFTLVQEKDVGAAQALRATFDMVFPFQRALTAARD